MKKILIVLSALVSFSALSANAADHYGTAGCGLGSVLMGPDSQVLAATTNASSYSQTFGITSGTSNCTAKGGMASVNQLPFYVEANRQAMANDIARGSGETVADLSMMFGCEDIGSFAVSMQKNYNRIFSSTQMSNQQVSDSILGVVKSDSALSTNCKI